MANGSESGKMEFINVERLTTELSDGVFGKNDTATGVDLNKTKVLFENSLLAGGDGLATPKPNVSTDFILNESAISPDASNGAKRKRDESPEHYSLVMNEDVEEDGSSRSGVSDGEDADSDMNKTIISALPDPDIDKQLPDTVTLLSTPDGAKVYLVGTAHFSTESQEDVAKIIQAVQPHIVLVELCKARVNILQLDEKTILEEAKNINFDKIQSTIRQNGMFHGVMYLLLLSMSAHLTKQLGMAPGGEFRRAFLEAKKVPSCLIHLGDRPIQITLKRALSSLSWWQTLRLTWHLLMCKEPVSKEEIERCKQRDLLEEMLSEMAGEFPALGTVFVNERDVYLTHSLQLAATPVAITASGDVTPARVVGVVGIGHVPGIVQNWGKVTLQDIPPIMRLPRPSLSGRIIKFTVKVSVVGLVVWGLSRLVPLPSLESVKSGAQGLFQLKAPVGGMQGV